MQYICQIILALWCRKELGAVYPSVGGSISLLLHLRSEKGVFSNWKYVSQKCQSDLSHIFNMAVNLTELSLPQLEGLKTQLEQVTRRY